MFKLTIELEDMTFGVDYSKANGNEDYFPPLAAALYDTLYLLSCVYNRKDVAEELFKGTSFMEFADNGLERLQIREKLYEAELKNRAK